MYKTGDDWEFYDQPMVANYSAFYRMPLGNPESVADIIATQPGNFGYELTIVRQRSCIRGTESQIQSGKSRNANAPRWIPQSRTQKDTYIVNQK